MDRTFTFVLLIGQFRPLFAITPLYPSHQQSILTFGHKAFKRFPFRTTKTLPRGSDWGTSGKVEDTTSPDVKPLNPQGPMGGLTSLGSRRHSPFSSTPIIRHGLASTELIIKQLTSSQFLLSKK